MFFALPVRCIYQNVTNLFDDKLEKLLYYSDITSGVRMTLKLVIIQSVTYKEKVRFYAVEGNNKPSIKSWLAFRKLCFLHIKIYLMISLIKFDKLVKFLLNF